VNVYLGFGHPLPIVLVVIFVIDVCALPFLIVGYVREALHPAPERLAAPSTLPGSTGDRP
jgi:hypothetical protein